MRQAHTNSGKRGYTIVELAIVIVVIGILAAITIVSYNGIQTRATNTSRVTEMQKYADLINLYQATFRKLPSTPDVADIPLGTHCLGTGFPQSPSNPNVRTCRNWNQTPGTNVTPTEASSARFMEELTKVGTAGNENHNNTSEAVIGPYVQIHNDMFVVTAVLKGNSQSVCDEFKVRINTGYPDRDGWNGGNIQTCGIVIRR
ncbi:MAG: prepilin-type N-terminal cleavage/methylation domain-containing protein [Chloroflexi bacterium]|nr:MAG: prepilin-type N-terminal cleavage/methylation domain-containing protein [Chloroflexota bacterium]